MVKPADPWLTGKRAEFGRCWPGLHNICIIIIIIYLLKGIVSRDFGWLQMILMDSIWVPDVPLKDYIFSNFCFRIVF